MLRLPVLVLVACHLVACHKHDDKPPPEPQTTAPVGPVVSEVEVSYPTGEVGGARLLSFSTDVPTFARVDLEGAEGTRSTTWSTFALERQVPVVGLRPGQPYTVRIRVEDEDGNATEATPVELVGDQVPPSTAFPELHLLSLEAGAVGDGWTIFTAVSPGAPGCWAILLDEGWTPVWWAHFDEALGDLELTPQGTLVGLGAFQIVEHDWMGRVVQRMSSSPTIPGNVTINVPFVHHEVTVMDDGTLLALGLRALKTDAYPTDYADPTGPTAPAWILDPAVARIDPSGAVVEELDLSTVLDLHRIGFGSLEVGEVPGFDWAGANAVDVDPADGAFVVTVKNQDAVVKVDPDGTLRWILGDPAGWVPPQADALLTQVGTPFGWPYHMHAAEPGADGRILLFDNAKEGHTPYTPDPGIAPVSRVMELEIDEAAGTVELVWEYTPDVDGPLYSDSLGDVDRLDNGSVLAVFGYLIAEGGQTNIALGRGGFSARVVQVDPAAPTPPIADLRVGSTADANVGGWIVYRAARLSTLLPQAD